jgi:hypothetical protein
MRRARTAIMVGVMSVATAASADAPWRAAEQLDLVPTPQQIRLDGGQVDLVGWKIVVAPDSRMAALGAEEINDRVTALGGEALARAASFPARGGAIVVGPCTDRQVAAVAEQFGLGITRDDPGPQGYGIRCGVKGSQPVIACVGSDEPGALYACVTLRRMVQRRDGRVVALTGSVRDWPDFRWRSIGRLDLRRVARSDDPETAAADAKGQIDFCLRHKVNHLFGQLWAVAADEAVRTRQEEIVRYAADRGIHLRFVGNTEIESYLSEEEREHAFEPRKGRIYLWSATDAHRRKAQDYAETARDVQAGMMALHPVDSGGYDDPEKWSLRPEPDRRRYGDDRAAASIEQFRIYFDAIRERSPGTLVEAVSYPYHYQFALSRFPERFPEMDVFPYRNWWSRIEDEATAREVQKRLVDYHRRVSETLDQSVFVTFREAGRNVFLACAKLYEGHPITIWTYPETYDGWHGTFVPQARYAKSFVREDYDDYFFVAGSLSRARDPRAQCLAHAEYLWNTDVPDGSDEFTVRSRLYEVGGQVTDYQRESLIPRIARALYGGADPEMADVMAANVSLNYVANPKAVASRRGEDVEDPYRFMADQADKLERLSGLLQNLTDRAENGRVAGATDADIRDEEGFRWVLFFFKYCRLAAVKARLEAEADRARKLVAAGKPKEAAEVAANLRTAIPEMAAACRQVRKRAAASGVSLPSGGPAGNALDTFDPACFEELLGNIDIGATDEESHRNPECTARTRTVAYHPPAYHLVLTDCCESDGTAGRADGDGTRRIHPSSNMVDENGRPSR